MASRNDVINQCTVVVKSFMRFDCLRKLLNSIWDHYPSLPVVIADDSLRPGQLYSPDLNDIRQHPMVTWMPLPFRSGLSAGRNVAVQACDRPYVLLCDDDFVFTEDTRIEDLLSVVQSGEFSLAAGSLFDVRDQDVLAWRASMAIRDRQLVMEPVEDSADVVPTDAFYNFFVATRESLLACPWDNRLNVYGEHPDFMLTRQHAGERSAWMPSVVAIHDRNGGEGGAEYMWHRSQPEKEMRYFFDKWGCDSWQYLPPSPIDSFRPFETFHRPVDTNGVIVMGVGHSGTSITTEFLATLGLRGYFDQWHEDPRVRALNIEAIQSRLNLNAARELLAGYGTDWVIKDTRFVDTLDQWIPLLEGHRPTLLWVTRDMEQVRQSHRRRNEREVSHTGWSLDDAYERARLHFANWPWAKFRVDHSSLCKAAALIESPRETIVMTIPTESLRLDVGGGRNCREGFTSIDRSTNADICHDLEVVPWPIADDSVEELWSSHTLEHIHNKFGFLYEIARVCRIGATVTIRTPHPMSESALTHGHVAVISESDLRNICEHFVDEFWTGSKRLNLLSVQQLPNGMWMDRAKESGRFKGWSDEDLMTWVPRTAHENEFVFKVVTR